MSGAGEGANGSVIRNDGTLTIRDSSGDDSGRITGGYAEVGGAVRNYSTLSFESGVICDNQARTDGGAIYQGAGITTAIENTYIDDNGSDQGAVFVKSGTVNMTGGSVSRNSAYYEAGAVFVSAGADFTAEGTVFNGNYSSQNGAGAFINHSKLALTDWRPTVWSMSAVQSSTSATPHCVTTTKSLTRLCSMR